MTTDNPPNRDSTIRSDYEELETALRKMAEHIIDGSARPGACSPCEQLVELARAALDQEANR